MATVETPISRQVRATRTPISPRLAMRIFRNCTGSLPGKRTSARVPPRSHPCETVGRPWTPTHRRRRTTQPYALSTYPKPTVVRIGQDLDRTGSIATPSWGDSIRVAANNMNQALKQSGHGHVRFEIVEGNSGNAPDLARASALELVKKEGAKAIITDSSQDDIAVNMLAYENDPTHDLGVPVVCMACTSPQIDDPAATDANPVKQAALRNEKGWNFRTTLSDAYQARVVSRVLLGRGKHGDVNGDGKFKLDIYASDDPYGRGFSNTLKGLVEA